MIDKSGKVWLKKGLVHLRRGEYFAAHEAWEIPWMEMSGASRIFWQAMIQLSVGAYHYQNNNLNGCRNLWKKALARCEILLADDSVKSRAIVKSLRDILRECLAQVEAGENPLEVINVQSTRRMDASWIDFE